MFKFHKYQGTGNDFIMIDNRNQTFDQNNLKLINQLCDRRFGIGADGLILINEHKSSDFEMVYYNADGSQSLCGNGSRCAVRFAEDLGIVKNSTNFFTIEGELEASMSKSTIRLKMPDVGSVDFLGKNTFFVNTGSPHYVQFFDQDIDTIDLITEARKIRYNKEYKEKGVNVNFVQMNSPSDLSVRTYERGVEDETFSCGTGVTAVSLAYSILSDLDEGVRLKTKGGYLFVDFHKKTKASFENIYLEGPAMKVFEGYIES